MRLIFLLVCIGFCMTAAETDFESERGSRVSWARLKFPVKGSSSMESAWDWHAHPTGDVRMIDFIRKNTSLNLLADWNVVDAEHLEKMCAFPYIFMHGQRTLNLSPLAENNIKEYLLRGGFLFIDDCVYQKYDPYQDMMYQSTLKLLKRLFPGVDIQRVGLDHELFKCYFKIRFFPHCQGKNNGISLVTWQGRLIAIITSSDIHCGWVSEGWFGAEITQETYRLGTNIYVYSMKH